MNSVVVAFEIQNIDLEKCDRKQLQELAKRFSIKANLTNEKIIDALTKIRDDEPIPDEYRNKGWILVHKKKVAAGGVSVGTIIIIFIIWLMTR